MAYAPQHVWLVDKRDGRKFRGPAHYTGVFPYIVLAPSERTRYYIPLTWTLTDHA